MELRNERHSILMRFYKKEVRFSFESSKIQIEFVGKLRIMGDISNPSKLCISVYNASEKRGSATIMEDHVDKITYGEYQIKLDINDGSIVTITDYEREKAEREEKGKLKNFKINPVLMDSSEKKKFDQLIDFLRSKNRDGLIDDRFLFYSGPKSMHIRDKLHRDTHINIGFNFISSYYKADDQHFFISITKNDQKAPIYAEKKSGITKERLLEILLHLPEHNNEE